MQASADCHYLEENPVEIAVLMAMLQGVVDDRPFSEIAHSLNDRGMRTRDSRPWTETAVFQMMPRLVEYSPELFARPEWKGRTRSLRIA